MRTVIINCYNLSTIEIIIKIRDIIYYLVHNNIPLELYTVVKLHFNNDIMETYTSVDNTIVDCAFQQALHTKMNEFQQALHTKMNEFTYGY